MADTEHVQKLAAIIREVDGTHSKGAAALAESILDHPRFRAVLADEPAVPEGREPAAVTGQPRLTEDDVEDAAQCIYEAMRFERVATTPAWSELGNSLAQDTARKAARAVLAHWGRQPAPPADGEVAELVGLFRHWAEAYPDSVTVDPYWLTRAAELLQRQVPVPVPVSERLPEPSTKVLAHYFNDLGRKRTICAIWVPAKSRSGDIGDDDFTEYDEEDDKFYWPEGWYEAIENWDDLGWIHVDEGEVVYWQPLPKWPAHALPLPEVSE